MLSSLRRHFFERLACAISLPFQGLPPRLLPITPSLSPFFLSSSLPSLIGETRERKRVGLNLARMSTASSPSPDAWTDAATLPYLSVRIRCRKDAADLLSDSLLCFGASSASVDEQDICGSTDEVCIESIFTGYEGVDTCISNAANSIGLKERPAYEVIKSDPCDWIKKSQESFVPVKVIDDLWIVPEWSTPPDLKATNIILNPGLAFGTGEHPTTKLCLLLLHGLIRGGELFLDYGTGSGILAIAALKFGAALSVGVDIDPQAITSARQNAALNNIEPEKMQLYWVHSEVSAPLTDGRKCGDVQEWRSCGMEIVSETEKYDIVIANILLNPLIEFAEYVVAYAKPGAVIGISGILTVQIPQIIECYSEYLEGITVSDMDNWACVSGTKKRNLRCS